MHLDEGEWHIPVENSRTGKQIQAFEDGETLRIRVTCKKDATARLDAVIPYGLAVTLEAKEDIPIYQQVRARIKQPVRIAPGVGR